MSKRIEQSRRHGHYDPRHARLHLVDEDVLADADLDLPFDVSPPALVLIGGTAFEQGPAATGTSQPQGT